MRYEPAVTIVPAHVDIVRSVLSDARLVTAWNESIASIADAPDAGTHATYAMAILTGVRGRFQFGLVEPDRLEFRWEVPDLREWGRWELESLGPMTRVGHVVSRHGALAISLEQARRGLAPHRVARLAAEVGNLSGRPLRTSA